MEKRARGQTEAEVAGTVAERFDREHGALVGRATTGLYLLFETLGIDDEVLFPAYTCPSPIYAAQYAGATPRFCDVRSDDYNLTAESVADALSEDTEAVVAINMFGHPVEYEKIAAVCADRDVLFIEDACQSIGSSYRGRTAGAFGEVSLLSFGEKKPLDAGGGGAVLAEDRDLIEEIRGRERDLPVRSQRRLDTLYDHYRELYYAIDDLRSHTDRAEQLFATLPSVFQELYVKGLPEAQIPAIADALDTYERTVEIRRSHAQIYRSRLSHPKLTHPEPLGDPVYYRYSLQLETELLRDHVVSVLRERDIHVSTLYDPIHQRFGDPGPYETAWDLSTRTINLWVDNTQDKTSVSRTADAVLDAIEAHSPAN